MNKLEKTTAGELLSMPKADNSKAFAAERKAYLKSLRELCPSPEIRKEARKLSRRKQPCSSCVFYDGETTFCWYPKSDAVIEDLKINPCYEGILRFLVEEAKPCEEIEALTEAPECLHRIILDDNKTICNVTELFLDYAGEDTPVSLINAIKSLHDLTMEYMEIHAEVFGIADPL